MDTIERSGVDHSTAIYDGFISYSHAADDLLAPRLQSGLQRFAKPWWKRRALRMFRDESSLSANPHLWSSITEALDNSGWFVLLLSPEAASSDWVNQEIEYWRTHKEPARILPVLTDGTFEWTGGDISGTAVPEQLQDTFSEEPRWVDMRFARYEEQLDLNNPRFSAAVADIASALRGVPKDELESEEVRQHRRTIRTAWAAVVLVGMLAVAATVFAIQSADNAQRAEAEAGRANMEADRAEANAEAEAEARAEAETNAELANQSAQLAKSRELAAAAVANLESAPELATLLALVALDSAPADDEPPVELVNAIWQTGSSNRLINVIETGYDGDLSLSNDGTHLVAITGDQKLAMLDARTHDVLWEYSEETGDTFVYPVIGPDGRTALPIFDSAAEWAGPVEAADQLPNRIVILDPGGTVEATLEFPDCDTAGNLDWSVDGSLLAVSFLDSCARDGFPQWVEIFETSSWTSVAFQAFEGLPLGFNPRFADDGRLFLLRSFEPTLVLEPATFRVSAELESTGIGDIAADGSRIFGFYTNEGFSGEAGTQWSVLSYGEDGTLQDILYTQIGFPDIPFGATATDDGLLIVAGTVRTYIHDFRTGELKTTLPTGPVSSLGYDGERQLLYTSGSDEGPRVWDMGASSVGVDQTGDLESYSWINGNHFVIGPTLGAFWNIDLSGPGQASVFDLITGEIVATVPDAVPRAALANGLFLLYMQEDDAEADAIFDPGTGELHRFFECVDFDPDVGCNDPGYNIAVSVDGTEMYAYPYSEEDANVLTGEVLTLDLASAEVLSTETPERAPLVIEAFTDEWELGSPTSRIDYRVADRQTGDVLWVDEVGHIRSIQSPDGRRFATFNGAEGVQLVDTETWQSTLIEGFVQVRGGSFNSDASLLAVGDLHSLRIIDVDSLQIAQQVRLPGVSDVYWVDDETLIVGTNDGVFGFLSLSTEEMITRTRAGLRRSFTDQECLIYRLDPCPSLDEMRNR